MVHRESVKLSSVCLRIADAVSIDTECCSAPDPARLKHPCRPLTPGPTADYDFILTYFRRRMSQGADVSRTCTRTDGNAVDERGAYRTSVTVAVPAFQKSNLPPACYNSRYGTGRSASVGAFTGSPPNRVSPGAVCHFYASDQFLLDGVELLRCVPGISSRVAPILLRQLIKLTQRVLKLQRIAFDLHAALVHLGNERR
jgi:hypothetical protein